MVNTEILEGDLLVLAAKQFENRENIRLDETHIHSSHKWKDKLVMDISLPAKQLIIMIKEIINLLFLMEQRLF